MKKHISINILCAVIALYFLASCGGGGGGEAGGGNPTAGNNVQPTTSVVKISTRGTLPQGSLIGGIDITISLPAGVSLKNTVSPPQTDSGVVVVSGVAVSNSMIVATYTPSSGTTSAKMRLVLVNSGGFGLGEFTTIVGDIAPGTTPIAADFSVTSFSAIDLNGVTLSGLTANITERNQ